MSNTGALMGGKGKRVHAEHEWAWEWYVCEYSTKGTTTHAWCFFCGDMVPLDDVTPHRMFHALKEAP